MFLISWRVESREEWRRDVERSMPGRSRETEGIEREEKRDWWVRPQVLCRLFAHPAGRQMHGSVHWHLSSWLDVADRTAAEETMMGAEPREWIPCVCCEDEAGNRIKIGGAPLWQWTSRDCIAQYMLLNPKMICCGYLMSSHVCVVYILMSEMFSETL